MVFKYETITLEDRVIEAKRDKEQRNSLISQFKPFIASVIQKRIGRYLEYGRDDQLSVGLVAFNEAITTFDKKKGKFLSFARIVITNRLIDYFRKQSRNKTIPLSYDDEGEDPLTDLMNKKSFESYSYKVADDDRRLEVIEYSQALKDWGISFSQVVRISPKHETLRMEYKKIAKIIAENPDLLEELERKRRLPIKEIEKIVSIHRKKIERGRIYIIALVVAILKKCSFLEIE
jgi:RNA polymerase sigma factor